MDKREKVIKGLEEIRDCESIVYKYRIDALEEAIALLKAQEPIRPNEIRHGDVLMYYQCPACTSALRAVDRYCSQCGRKVEWE